MGIQINGGLDIRWPALADLRSGPYANKAAALAAVPTTRRANGLVLFVTNDTSIDWYQFRGGIEDDDLVKIFEIIYNTEGHVTVTDVGGEKQFNITNWNGEIEGDLNVNGGITLADNDTAPGEGQIVLNGGILQIKIGGVVKDLTS